MFPYTKLCSLARPPAEVTLPLAYLVRSPAAFSAVDIERASNTAHEEETNWIQCFSTCRFSVITKIERFHTSTTSNHRFRMSNLVHTK